MTKFILMSRRLESSHANIHDTVRIQLIGWIDENKEEGIIRMELRLMRKMNKQQVLDGINRKLKGNQTKQ